MRSSSLLAVTFLLLVMALAAWQFRDAAGCAALPPLHHKVTISEETAIILWDEAQKIEHFIRSATFASDADDFGFLVPTSSQPTLHEVDQGAFSMLAAITAPQVIHTNKPATQTPSRGFGCSSRASSGPTLSAPPPVRVLEETRVAGHDATVLEADDPESLAAWLKEHGYPSSPELTQWLEPYVAAQWKITAFKYVRAPNQPRVASAAVRLTFATDRPLYPYREPAEAEDDEPKSPQREKSRMLRVYFVGPGRYQGELGEPAQPWQAKTVWAGPLPGVGVIDRFAQLCQSLKIDDLADGPDWWLTEFEDTASPRPNADDLYFVPSAQQAQVAKPPVYASHDPAPRGDATAYLAAAGLVALFVYASRRRR